MSEPSLPTMKDTLAFQQAIVAINTQAKVSATFETQTAVLLLIATGINMLLVLAIEAKKETP